VTSRSSPIVAAATDFTGDGYDLVTTFDCLHDMGDPVGAARHVLRAMAPDGTWMIVEPAAGDRVEDYLNPVGRGVLRLLDAVVYPASRPQSVGAALGTQAGPARIRAVTAEAGLHPVPAGRADAVQQTSTRSDPDVSRRPA
jgi:hypothetical protein